jgi:DNA invertase Pin-like site-specific DNA recombinase
MKRAALYVRVSTSGQTTESQERELRAVAEKGGLGDRQLYAGLSGAKGRDQIRFRLCKDAARRKFDMALSRSLGDLTGFLKDLQALNVDLYLHRQGLHLDADRKGQVPDGGGVCGIGARCHPRTAWASGRFSASRRL